LRSGETGARWRGAPRPNLRSGSRTCSGHFDAHKDTKVCCSAPEFGAVFGEFNRSLRTEHSASRRTSEGEFSELGSQSGTTREPCERRFEGFAVTRGSCSFSEANQFGYGDTTVRVARSDHRARLTRTGGAKSLASVSGRVWRSSIHDFDFWRTRQAIYDFEEIFPYYVPRRDSGRKTSSL